MNNEIKYYAIRNKALANALHWLTGQRFYIMNSDADENIKNYTFEKTDELMEALTILNNTKNYFNKGGDSHN